MKPSIQFLADFKPFIQVQRDDDDGTYIVFKFGNRKFGASVVWNEISYGYKNGLWECALIHWVTPIGYRVDTSHALTRFDVLGYQSESDVVRFLKKVQKFE